MSLQGAYKNSSCIDPPQVSKHFLHQTRGMRSCIRHLAYWLCLDEIRALGSYHCDGMFSADDESGVSQSRFVRLCIKCSVALPRVSVTELVSARRLPVIFAEYHRSKGRKYCLSHVRGQSDILHPWPIQPKQYELFYWPKPRML